MRTLQPVKGDNMEKIYAITVFTDMVSYRCYYFIALKMGIFN